MSRDFDIPEIQILIDAVQAASFVTEMKTPILVDKLAQLAGTKRAGSVSSFSNNMDYYYRSYSGKTDEQVTLKEYT